MYLETPMGSLVTSRYLALSAPDGMLLGALIYLLYFCATKKKRLRKGHKASVWQFLLESSLSIYLGALAALTIHLIWPWAWHISGQATSWALRSIRWDPLSATLLIFHNAVNYDNMRAFYRIVGGNFIMLMPLGILLCLRFPKLRFWKLALIGLGTAVSIEALQLLFNILGGSVTRTVEIDDVLLNTAGYLVATGLLVLVRLIWRRLRNRKQAKGRKAARFV